MEDDLHIGLYIVVVLCLVVIAASAHKVAFTSSSYFGEADKAALAHRSERTDRFNGGGYEPPVFWNMGSVKETNEALQAASQEEKENAAAAVAAVVKAATSESFAGKSPKSFTDIESFAGKGL